MPAVPAGDEVAAPVQAVPGPEAGLVVAARPAPEAVAGTAAPVVAPVAAPAAVDMSPYASPEYLALVRARLDRYKVYPLAAQHRRQQGVAIAHLSIARNGRVKTWRLAHSTGHADLDEEIAKLIFRSDPFPPVRDAVERPYYEVFVPIVFMIRY